MDFKPDATQEEITRLAATVLRRDPERPWQALADSGLLLLALPAGLDGDDPGLAEVALVLTEVGRAAAATPALASLALGALPIGKLGSARTCCPPSLPVPRWSRPRCTNSRLR